MVEVGQMLEETSLVSSVFGWCLLAHIFVIFLCFLSHSYFCLAHSLCSIVASAVVARK